MIYIGYSAQHTNPVKTIVQPNMSITSLFPTEYGQNVPRLPLFQHLIQREDPNAPLRETLLNIHNPEKQDVPIASPSNGTIFTTYFDSQRDKLTVFLLGNNEVPDVQIYASSITTVEFVGHISFTSPMFEIISQLPNTKKVILQVGKSQLPLFRDFQYCESVDMLYEVTTRCPHVQALEVTMDLECYYAPPKRCTESDCKCGNTCWDQLRHVLDSLVESFFKRAMVGFPNLRQLITELPDTDMYYGCVNSLIESCPLLRNRTKVKVLDGPSSDSAESSNNSIYENEKSMDFTRPATPIDWDEIRKAATTIHCSSQCTFCTLSPENTQQPL